MIKMQRRESDRNNINNIIYNCTFCIFWRRLMKKIITIILFSFNVVAQDTIIVTDDDIKVCDYNEIGILICI